MANPQVHARSSARKFGGHWSRYVGLHAFLDSSKLHYAKAQHRALLHHSWGKELAMEVFSEAFFDLTLEQLIDQHLAEDFNRFVPSVHQWWQEFHTNKGPKVLMTLDIQQQCDESVRQFGGQAADYRELHEFLDSVACYDLPGPMGITHSTFGLFLAETKFGYVVGQREVPTRTVAEKHILAEYGTIPTAQEWLDALPLRPWMYNQATQLSLEMDASNV